MFSNVVLSNNNQPNYETPGIEELHYAAVRMNQIQRKVLHECESSWVDEVHIDETLLQLSIPKNF